MANERKEIKTDEYTKYEKARVIGARALQIGMGAPFLIKLNEKELERIQYNPINIATMEFEEDIIPISIIRPLPKVHKAPKAA